MPMREAQMQLLGVELKQYLPDKYSATASVKPEELNSIYGSFYAGQYDKESLKGSFFQKDVPIVSEPSRRKISRQS